MSLKVFLVEDHEIVRLGIKALLEGSPEVKVIGEASNGSEAIKQLEKVKPDVLILDMDMPVMNGVECTRLVRKMHSDIKVLILSMPGSENHLADALEAGANGYILKNSSREELIFAVRKIANNGVYIASEFAVSLVTKFKPAAFKDSGKADIDLTDRERDVLNLVSQGLTNTEIASKLFTSVRTIETRRKKLLEKTGTTNTATLIRFCVLNGLVK